jgi:hypothetical protein
MVPAQRGAGRGDLVLAQRGAVRTFLAGLGRRAEADGGAAADQHRAFGFGDGGADRLPHFLGVVAVDVADHQPAVGLEATRRVVGEPAGDIAVDGDAVVVPEGDQLVQAEAAGQRTGFVRDTFHQAAVAEEHPGAVVDDGEAVAVEAVGQHLLGQRHAHRVGEALAQRPGGGFHTRRFTGLRMPGGLRVQLAEALQLFDRQRVAGEVQQGVLQHRTVTVGEHEAVAVGPLRVGRVVGEEIVPQHFGDVGHAHRHARMAGLRRLDGIDGEKTDGIGEVAAAGRRHGGVAGEWKEAPGRAPGRTIVPDGSGNVLPRRRRRSGDAVAEPDTGLQQGGEA